MASFSLLLARWGPILMENMPKIIAVGDLLFKTFFNLSSSDNEKESVRKARSVMSDNREDIDRIREDQKQMKQLLMGLTVLLERIDQHYQNCGSQEIPPWFQQCCRRTTSAQCCYGHNGRPSEDHQNSFKGSSCCQHDQWERSGCHHFQWERSGCHHYKRERCGRQDNLQGPCCSKHHWQESFGCQHDQQKSNDQHERKEPFGCQYDRQESLVCQHDWREPHGQQHKQRESYGCQRDQGELYGCQHHHGPNKSHDRCSHDSRGPSCPPHWDNRNKSGATRCCFSDPLDSMRQESCYSEDDSAYYCEPPRELRRSWRECNVCRSNYNFEDRRPTLMSCGHTFCRQCLWHVAINGRFRCPTCNADERRPVSTLPPNVGVMDALREDEQKKKKKQLNSKKHNTKKNMKSEEERLLEDLINRMRL